MVYSRKLDPLIHITGWILFFSLFLFFMQQGPRNGDLWDRVFSWSFLLFASTYLFIFYLNYYILVPKLYFRNYTWLYLLCIVLLLLLIVITRPFDRLITEHLRFEHTGPPLPHPEEEDHYGKPFLDITGIIAFIMIGAISSAIRFLRQWKEAVQQTAAAESEKANAELSFLKAQVNPHFLFNTLNNIYALTVTKSDAAPDAVMRLSNIMRYVTDDTTSDYVSLQAEVDCIRDFIDLQRLRLTDKVQIELRVSGSLETTRIPPLLLMPFVENAFKHGISSHDPAAISISIGAKGQSIHFHCANRIFTTAKAERMGIGIPNTVRRLEYLYGKRYALNISDANEMFIVDLKMED